MRWDFIIYNENDTSVVDEFDGFEVDYLYILHSVYEVESEWGHWGI